MSELARLVLTTGGTGGHIFPALAVAEEARKRWPGLDILFIGGSFGPEGRLAQAAGLSFAGLPVRGVLGRGLKSLAALWSLARGVVTARGLLARFKPQVVAGFGGYAGFCPVLAAKILGLPTAIHEQNSVPGLTNRILAKGADLVMVSFDDERGSFPPGKVVRTGNPVRAAIRSLRDIAPAPLAGRAPRLLVLGGSQGAMAVNTAVITALSEFKAAGLAIRHQTGQADLERVRTAYRAAGLPDAQVTPFIDEMAVAYGWADLVVGRAGATTIAEITAAGKPSVLIPFPHATHDHQTVNADFLARRRAALMLTETSVNELGLARVVLDLLADPARLAEMGAAAGELGRPEAAEQVVDHLARLAERRHGRG
jgi:UDP-N-acetylglucosamine--N-acetylmuramyl-(pentapeptide) pyrophosphoryl-undecaprenol N-acetylglucosamine transferase